MESAARLSFAGDTLGFCKTVDMEVELNFPVRIDTGTFGHCSYQTLHCIQPEVAWPSGDCNFLVGSIHPLRRHG